MTVPPRLIHQVCILPYRPRGELFQFCLITSLGRKRWIFPKGIIDPGETYVDTALKEAREEAGLYGQVVGSPLGSYQDSKWGATLDVCVVLMQVTAWDQHWEEADQRERRWVSAAEALQLLSRTEHKRFLQQATALLGSQP